MNNKILKAVSLAASDDKSRPSLTFVRIKDGLLMATDGFIAAKTKNILSYEDTFILAKSLKGLKDNTIVNDSDGSSLSLFSNNEETIIRCVDPSSLSYPQFDRIYEQAAGNELKIAFDVDILDKLVKIVKASGQKSVTLSIGDSHGVIGAQVGQGEEKIEIALMPKNI